MTKRELAKRVKKSPVIISYVFSKKRTPTVKLCKDLAKVTGIPAKTWMFGTREELSEAWKKFNAEWLMNELEGE